MQAASKPRDGRVVAGPDSGLLLVADGGPAAVNLAILQARRTSPRLPGKVMAPVPGEPMIGRLIERLRRAAGIDKLMVATSDDASDAPLAAYCEGLALE